MMKMHGQHYRIFITAGISAVTAILIFTGVSLGAGPRVMGEIVNQTLITQVQRHKTDTRCPAEPDMA
jgi:hypothetical protein